MIQGGAVRASSDYAAGSDFTMDHLFKEFAFDCNQGKREKRRREVEGRRPGCCMVLCVVLCCMVLRGAVGCDTDSHPLPLSLAPSLPPSLAPSLAPHKAIIKLPGSVIAESVKNSRTTDKPAPNFLHLDKVSTRIVCLFIGLFRGVYR